MTDEILRRLQFAQELNRAILEAMPGGVVHVSAEGAVKTANREAQRVLGLSFDELTQRYITDFDPVTLKEDGSHCPVDEYPVTRCLITGEPQPPMTIGVQRPDGATTWAVFTAVPVPDPDTARPSGAVVTFLDVTAERRARKELEASQQMVRAIFEGSRLGLGTATLDGQFITVNQAFCDFLGYPCEELCQLSVEAITGPEDLDRTRSILSSMSEVKGATDEKRYRHKSGRLVWGRTSVALARLGESQVLVFTVEDIDESRRVRGALQQSQKLESLGVLAGGIAHDFSNLMVGVLGNAGLALSEIDPSSPMYELLTDIELAGVRASELCRQLLAYAGRSKFVVEPVDLSRLILDSASLLEIGVTRAVQLDFDLADELPWIEADATQVRQVVMNLISNAADACHAGGQVKLRTGVTHWSTATHPTSLGARDLPPGERVYLSVQDTGAGMDEDTQRRMFDPFFTTKFTGRGLGLASTMGIVQTHKGAITVDSAPGRGTTVTIFFPPSEPPASRRRPAPTPLSWRSTGLVLVIDDEPMVRTVAEKMLGELGFRVDTAMDGHDGLRRFGAVADQVTFALVDMTMPRLSGVETARRLREIRPDLPVLMTSGYSEDAFTDDLGGTGPHGFIQKPYRADELSQVIQRLLLKE